MTELSAVGKSIVRIDALDKVTGAAVYTMDEGIGLADMLYGKLLLSPYAHAKILSIDASRAERVPGIKVVVTGKDVPDQKTGIMVQDRHILCREKVRFVGDAVAAVAAENIEAAEEAIDLIRVEYEELPAVFDAEEAMKPDCPVVLHPDLANYIRPQKAYLGLGLPGPNALTHHKVRKGNVDDGFRKADLIVENRFSVARVGPCQIEPHNSVAYLESDGSLTVWSSEGHIFPIVGELSSVFGLPRDKVRIRASYAGGSFGAAPRAYRFAALLALKTKRPVKVVYSRKECFLEGFSRAPVVIYIKDGVKNDGTLLAREVKLIMNNGAYSAWGPLVTRNAAFQASQYRVPNFKWDGYGVYTNQPVSGPYRGFGNTEALWAAESQMDIIAEKLGMDPVELRKRNIIREGEENVRGEITQSIGAEECLDKVAEWWRKPSEASTGSLRIGKGIALGNKYTQMEGAASVIVKVHMNGTVEVLHGSDEVGQGCNTLLAQIAAEEFNIPVEKVKVVWGDTAMKVFDSGAVSSKTTIFTGNALLRACQDAKRQIFELAALKLKVTPQDLEIKDGKVYIRGLLENALPIADIFPPRKSMSWDALAAAAYLAEGEGEMIVGRGLFYGPYGDEDPETGQGKALAMSYCYVAQAVEVAVDIETGVVKVLRACSASDAGRAINPKMCEGQMEGGIAQGIGLGLYEEFMFDEKGQLLNPDFTDYKIPSAQNIPSGDNIKTMIVEAPHKVGPFGGKGMGEASMVSTAPAMGNAIYNAVGIRIADLPITAEKVLKALEQSEKQ